MEDFWLKFEDGLKGENKGLITGMEQVSKAMDNIQKETNYVLFGQPKTFKTKFSDVYFILQPYLLNDPALLDYTYYSFEVNRIKKVAEWIAYFFWYDFRLRYTAAHIMSRGEKKVKSEHIIHIETILKNRIIPLLGEYDKSGNRVKKGLVDFIEDKDNPTGIYHYLINKAKQHGKIIEEEYESQDDLGNKVKRKRIIGYEDYEKKKYRIVLTDHVRLLKRERNYSMKENIDKYSEYTIYLRNVFKYSFVDIIHSNRSISDNDRVTANSGRFLRPQIDDVKDSGNLAENANYLMALFNPYNYPGLNLHFDYDLKHWKGKYRSLHILAARDTEAPKDLFLICDGGNSVFRELPLATDSAKIAETKKRFDEYELLNND
jgi:hypothetical protein